VLGLELREELAELGLGVEQPLVEGFFPAGVTAVAWCSPLPTSRPPFAAARRSSACLFVYT
jgi:hypothetical protein